MKRSARITEYFKMGSLPCVVVLAACLFQSLPLLAAPTINSPTAAPASIPVKTSSAVIFTAAIADPTVIASSVNLQRLNVNGTLYSNVGTLYDDGTHGDATAADGTYSLLVNLNEPSPFPITFRVSAGVLGSLTRIFSSPIVVNVTGATAATVNITSPSNLAFLNSSPVTLRGTVSDPTATVTVNGLTAPVTAGAFTLAIPLQEGNNTLTASAKNSQGAITTASVQVSLDTTPPKVTIDSPFDAFATTDASITVTGKANDTVVGTVNSQQLSVTVNGVAAQVANRGFQAVNVPLVLGNNTIAVTATDQAGNGATAQITVRRDPATQSLIKIISGNNQTGTAGSPLGSPIVAGLFDGAGNPVGSQTVVFAVTQNNGTLSSSKTIVGVTTDASGHAQVPWTIGTRSGAGNNIVEATAVGFAGSAVFVASGNPGGPAQINLDAGSQQTGVAGQALPHPFIVAVTDAAHNRLANIPVTFTVKKGGGNFGGQPSIVAITDGDGRAAAFLTLGPQDGIENNVVEATFPGNSGLPTAFTSSGRIPGDPAGTRITGVVLDNSDNPVPGATIRAYLQNVAAQQSGGLPPNVSAVSDAQGQFTIQPAPVGFVKIIADGSTVQRPGKWPNLEYELVTVSGQNNTIGLPVYLLPLDTTNQLCVTASTGGTLTLPAIPGFALTVIPGAATFPGGSRSGCLTVTAVHPDKIPMVPGFGQQPRFIVTIQPAGTLFSPAAAVTIPNSEGLKPKEVTEMYSFDHDLATFVSVGTATVSDDGTVIRSDPGVGVLKAGWYCGGPPTPSGTVGACQACAICQGASCIPDLSSTATCDDNKFCTTNDTCSSGVCKGTDVPEVSVAKGDFAVPGIVDELRAGFNSAMAAIDLGFSIPKLEGSLGYDSSRECCEGQQGALTEKTSVSGTLGVPFDSGRITPFLPPWSQNATFKIFGHPIGVRYGVFGQVKGNIGITLSYVKKACEHTSCWQGSVPSVVTFTGGLTGDVPDPTSYYTCGPMEDQQCDLFRLTAGFSTGFNVTSTFGCDQVAANIGWSGLTFDVAVAALEGSLFEVDTSFSLTLFQPKNLWSTTSKLPV